MRTFHEIPEHILHDIISIAIDSTRFVGWQLSLRSVNRRFNEAVLHVYYLRKRLLAMPGGHSLDCINPCHHTFCNMHMDFGLKRSYAARFNFQHLLAIGDLHGNTTHAHQLLQQWKAALTILRGVDIVKRLDLDQVRFYSTCSDNPIFNDAPSAILAEAVGIYPGLGSMIRQVESGWKVMLGQNHHNHPPAFWVALSACVLGDMQLFETYTSKLFPTAETSSPLGPPNPLIAYEPVALLTVAIKHAKLYIVSRLLEQHPNIMSEICTCRAPLQAAIFSDNNEVLEALLAYTPNLPDLLADALSRYRTLLPRSSSGSETIRLLTRHFTPLSAESRTWLIMHSCAVGDVGLLEEFSKTEPLFSHPTFDAGGTIETYAHFAIRRGNVDSLRFLIDHGVYENPGLQRLTMVKLKALSYNQIECYRELHQRFDEPLSIRYFEYLTFAENAESLIDEFIYQDGCLVFRLLERSIGPAQSLAQRALGNAIQRLRPEYVQFLLTAGQNVFPCLEYNEDPFEIRWPYFNQNRNAFLRTQEVLDAFNLPKLRIIV